MRKVINKERVEGLIYDHTLTVKTVQSSESANYGKNFISGNLDIATDDDCENIVTVHYTYVAEATKSGAKNNTYTALNSIIESGKTILSDGAANATMVRLDPSLALNDFYSDRAITDTNPEGLVSSKRNEGGFATIVTKLSAPESRNTFEADMLINGTRYVEPDEERGTEGYLVVKGAIFNFRGSILPVEFFVRSKGGIDYFEGLEASASNLVFTKVWGRIVSHQESVKRVEESAFGEDKSVDFVKTTKEWVITGAAKEPYEIDDAENGITIEEIKKAMADREVYLADIKKRQEEYQATKETPSVANASAPAAAGGFNF